MFIYKVVDKRGMAHFVQAENPSEALTFVPGASRVEQPLPHEIPSNANILRKAV